MDDSEFNVGDLVYVHTEGVFPGKIKLVYPQSEMAKARIVSLTKFAGYNNVVTITGNLTDDIATIPEDQHFSYNFNSITMIKITPIDEVYEQIEKELTK